MPGPGRLSQVSAALCPPHGRLQRAAVFLAAGLAAAATALLAACAAQPASTLPAPVGATKTAVVEVSVVALPPTATPPPVEASFVFPADIWVGQHVASSGSYSQTEMEAAGPMFCRIERNSCAFGHLVRVPADGLIFVRSAPPHDDEVSLMHANMVRPLMRLRDLTLAEWGGEVKLLVTAAYDSQGQHDLAQKDLNRKYSLHFEGRSIDLVPFPPEPEHIARLCALALQAGFDWVHNEQDHCHASVAANSLCAVCSWKAPP